MSSPSAARILSVTATVALALLTAFCAAPRDAAALAGLRTFPVSVDVRLDLEERSIWKGIRPGCFAPAEDFDMTYKIAIRSRPTAKSKLVPGAATVDRYGTGATPTFGALGSFRQSGSAKWILQTENEASCNTEAPEPPAWATSPTCRNLSERVAAALIYSPIGEDGSLQLTRTPKAALTAKAGDMGASCLRTLHPIDAVGRDALIGIGLKSTIITVPVPQLKGKLKDLASGSAKARPSFAFDVRVGGDCVGMSMRPSNGPDPEYRRAPYSQPSDALGAFNGDFLQTPCGISGEGRVVVRRVGAVKFPLSGSVPKGVKLPKGLKLP